MDYEVKITLQAFDQIQQTIAYVTNVLLSPDTAKAWADRLEQEISSLNSMPKRYPLIEREPWRSKGFRKMVVHNFIVYYFLDEEKQVVWVTMVIYGKRDQLNALKNMPL